MSSQMPRRRKSRTSASCSPLVATFVTMGTITGRCIVKFSSKLQSTPASSGGLRRVVQECRIVPQLEIESKTIVLGAPWYHPSRSRTINVSWRSHDTLNIRFAPMARSVGSYLVEGGNYPGTLTFEPLTQSAQYLQVVFVAYRRRACKVSALWTNFMRYHTPRKKWSIALYWISSMNPSLKNDADNHIIFSWNTYWNTCS